MSTSRLPTRYDRRLPALELLIEQLGEPAYRARQVYEGLYAQRRPLETLTNLPKALLARLADELPLAFTADTMQLADEDTTAKWLWRAADGAQIETVLMRYSDARDRLRFLASGVCDGLHVLRDRPGRLRTSPVRGRDRGAGRTSSARVAATRVERRVHGNGRTTRQRRRGTRRVHTAARGRRHLRTSPHRLDRRRRTRYGTADRVRAARHPRGLVARARRRVPRPARAAQPPLPDRGRARCGAAVRRTQGPPGLVRVRVHQRRQRSSPSCRRARRAPHRFPGRRAREPDPVERHRGISGPAERARPHRRLRPTAAGGGRTGHDPAQSRDLDRRGLWPAPSRELPDPATRGAGATPRSATMEP